VFTVRRQFDWENKYKNTVVDIKSKLLREALQEIMKDVKGVSFVEDVPTVSLKPPNWTTWTDSLSDRPEHALPLP